MTTNKKKKDETIAARQVKAPELVNSMKDVPEGLRPEPEDKDPTAFLGLAAQVAEDTTYIRNTRWKNAHNYFPTEPGLRTVEKLFPYALGGPLYVDLADTLKDQMDCERKAEAMEKEGLRYCYITPEMELKDVLAQLKGDDVGVA